jgi:hypothetical protein
MPKGYEECDECGGSGYQKFGASSFPCQETPPSAVAKVDEAVREYVDAEFQFRGKPFAKGKIKRQSGGEQTVSDGYGTDAVKCTDCESVYRGVHICTPNLQIGDIIYMDGQGMMRLTERENDFNVPFAIVWIDNSKEETWYQITDLSGVYRRTVEIPQSQIKLDP